MNRWIKRSIIALGVIALLCAGGLYAYVANEFHFGPPDDRSAWLGQNATVNSGQLAYIQRDVAAAMDIWHDVAADETARNEDRAEAFRLLSRTSWRIYQNTDDGISFAHHADGIDDTLSANAVTLSDAFREAGDFEAAFVAARTAAHRAQDPLERNEAANAFARATLASTSGLRLDELTEFDLGILEEARAVLQPFFAHPPANLETSALALEIAVRLDDGLGMLQAWTSYYHSPTGRSSTADQSAAAAVLNARLPQWRGAESSYEVRRDVALALAQSHFYALASQIITDRRSPHSDPLLQDEQLSQVVDIADFRAALTQHTDEYYRRIAEANTSSVFFAGLLALDFRGGRSDLERDLWQDLSQWEDLGPYSHDAFLEDASDRFMLYQSEGTTSGVYDSHTGHRVLDTTVVADQFGRTAELRFVVVGRMVSNGYESWLWDGRQQHGGWARNDAIFQVRPAYADGPLRRWHTVTDPVLRTEREEEIERLTAQDALTAASAPVAYFAGLAARLRWQGLNGILENARAHNPPELVRQAFILELGNTTFQFSILAHEGRHALDKNFAEPWVRENSPELEFRAKLSEVVFSDWPRLAFGAIFNPNLGSDTPHGIANQRIAQGALLWMEEHAAEIDGLDPEAPLLPQFDLLTDDQIRSAFLSMDPWAPANQTANVLTN